MKRFFIDNAILVAAVVLVAGLLLSNVDLRQHDTIRWSAQPAIAATTYPTPPPLDPGPYPSALPTSSAAASPVPWKYVSADGSFVDAQKQSHCSFNAIGKQPVAVYHNSSTTTIILVCSNGAVLVGTSTGF